jgi:PAS domain-containing protein
MSDKSTLNALPDAIFVIAHDGSFAALNPLARAILRSKGGEPKVM